MVYQDNSIPIFIHVYIGGGNRMPIAEFVRPYAERVLKDVVVMTCPQFLLECVNDSVCLGQLIDMVLADIMYDLEQMTSSIVDEVMKRL